MNRSLWLVSAPTLTALGSEGRERLRNLILYRAAEKLTKIPARDQTQIACQCVLEFAAEEIVREQAERAAR